MRHESTYPWPEKRRRLRKRLMDLSKWPLLFAAYFCPILNLCLGGKAWSAVVVWSVWMLWSLALAPAMVEYNRLSQSIKIITDACILMILIDTLLSPGWAVEAVPIVCFSGLTAAGILFFTDLERQKQNIAPMLSLSAICLVASIVGILVWRRDTRWAFVVMGAFSFALLAACFYVLGRDMLRALRKYFHTE